MKPSELVVRAVDGSRRTIVGEIDLPMKIGPHTFSITFFVMDIHLAYSYILGRPWIHSSDVVTSTLHQRLEFLVDDKLVVVEGEEDILVSYLAYFCYIEKVGEMKEISFQSFEVINIEMVSLVRDEPKNAKFLMAYLQDTLTIINNGHPKDGEECLRSRTIRTT